jgi:hypothetical protein
VNGDEEKSGKRKAESRKENANELAFAQFQLSSFPDSAPSSAARRDAVALV